MTTPAPTSTPPSATPFALRGEHITLDALLKATGLASSGGEAKTQIVSGGVQVNGQLETRRGRKLRAGDVVLVMGQAIAVQGSNETQADT
jgi:ribosome-associated protein